MRPAEEYAQGHVAGALNMAGSGGYSGYRDANRTLPVRSMVTPAST
ncbi:hypothetical protein [Thiocystis minor]